MGHSVSDITAGYTHTRRKLLLADADKVASALARMLRGEVGTGEKREVAPAS